MSILRYQEVQNKIEMLMAEKRAIENRIGQLVLERCELYRKLSVDERAQVHATSVPAPRPAVDDYVKEEKEALDVIIKDEENRRIEKLDR